MLVYNEHNVKGSNSDIWYISISMNKMADATLQWKGIYKYLYVHGQILHKGVHACMGKRLDDRAHFGKKGVYVEKHF